MAHMSRIFKTWIRIHDLGGPVFFPYCVGIDEGPSGLKLQIQNLSNITLVRLGVRSAVHGT